MWIIICIVFWLCGLAATLFVADKISYNKKWWLKLLFALLVVFDAACLVGIFYSADYYDTINYRELNKPTIEDVTNGYAKIDTITIIRNGEQHEEYEILWIGNKKGKREQ